MGNVNFNEANRPANQGFKSTSKDANPLHSQANPLLTQQPQVQPNLNMNTNMLQSQQNQLNNGFGMNNNSNFNSGSVYNNLLYGNMNLSNYLNTVKSNNNGLFEGMMNPSVTDQMMHKSNIDRFMQSEQHQKML